MVALVTGGFGFIGSHLVEALLAEERRVHVVDDLSTSPLPLEAVLDEIGRPDALTYSVQDVASFCADTPDEPFEEVFHLASFVGPASLIGHAGRIAVSIIESTCAVADLAARCGATMLDLSTSEVYCGNPVGLCDETGALTLPTRPTARLEYAIGKLAAETALLNRHRAQGLDCRIVRPFNVAGPRQSGVGGFVLPRFIGQALCGIDLTVFGDGQAVRAFTHVRDIVDGLLLVMRKGRHGEVYNFGNAGNGCTIFELAQRVIQTANSPSSVAYVDPTEIFGPLYAEVGDKLPDASRALAELGWRPQRDLSQTIAETYAYMTSLPQPQLERLRGFEPVRAKEAGRA